jgi:hypothetical protein
MQPPDQTLLSLTGQWLAKADRDPYVGYFGVEPETQQDWRTEAAEALTRWVQNCSGFADGTPTEAFPG